MEKLNHQIILGQRLQAKSAITSGSRVPSKIICDPKTEKITVGKFVLAQVHLKGPHEQNKSRTPG
jgi:hypothetical protein